MSKSEVEEPATQPRELLHCDLEGGALSTGAHDLLRTFPINIALQCLPPAVQARCFVGVCNVSDEGACQAELLAVMKGPRAATALEGPS